ncbi:hypothetical protein DPMN_033945 [Dreissena polymorpha]|uniref:Uncharacterized protein n=1 Tax=Dreissena polymorpha TaxID=45954 RepID=A0A9D4M4Q9_DREPO|nr:hypothetical protein DPMN_033945 [Dreissena polymorpha]
MSSKREYLRSIAEQITTFNTLQSLETIYYWKYLQLCAQHTIACWSGLQSVHVSAWDISVTLDTFKYTIACWLVHVSGLQLIVACTTLTDCPPCITHTLDTLQTLNPRKPKTTQVNPSRPKSTQIPKTTQSTQLTNGI